MKKLIYNKVDKTMVSALKKVEFYGRIVIVDTPSKAQKAVDFLLSQPVFQVVGRSVQ